jgi:hypothetical protein
MNPGCEVQGFPGITQGGTENSNVPGSEVKNKILWPHESVVLKLKISRIGLSVNNLEP